MIGRYRDERLTALPAPARHRRRRQGQAGLARTLHLAVAVTACLGVFLSSPGRPALAASAAVGSPCGPAITVIACENSLPGDPAADWQIGGSGDATIQGFATDMSVNVGGTVAFKVSTPATAYHIDILRIGYYQGNGARKIVPGLQPSASLPQSQPNCLSDVSTGLVDCGNWAVSASWTVPATAVSGVYIAHLVRNDTGGSSQIIFVVRNDASTSDVFFQTSDPTWQAYNRYGGNDFYAGGPFTSAFGGRAAKVSYNRPMLTRDCCEEDFFFHAEYPVIRFLEANGYDTSYTSGVDSDRNGALIKNHRVFVSTGHDEYWSGAQRANVETARDAGVNLAFISGNNIYWKTRWEPSADGSGYRVLVCYKETWANQVIDPRDAAPTWTSTGTWRDPRFSPPGDAGRPENSLTGTLFTVNAGTLTMQVPSEYAALRFWRNTAVAALTPGQVLSLAPNSLGYEWDEDVDNGFRPAGVLDMSSTTGMVEKITDYGGSVGPGSATHHLTLYRAPSGALVFSAGTVQWAWGLDDTHDATLPAGVDLNMQQATVNLLADMQAQPATLQAAYKPATRSADVTPPQSSITGPSTIVHTNTAVLVTGTAHDAAGGVVAGVEVSTDGGGTWHPATGTTNWSYNWVPATAGTSVLQSRAVDDSGNLERPSAGVQAAVVTACPCSLWSSGATPDTASESKDSSSVEIGTRFVSNRAGKVTGMSFYKGAGNGGTHTGTLWSASGTALASVTFSNETATGWQTAAFAQPVMVTAGTQYVISYHAPLGHYADSLEYFATSGHGAGPLQAPRDVPTAANGVYAYAPGSVFPALTHEATNYWVDVVFTPTTGPGVTGSPASGARGVDPGTAVNATFSAAVQASTITFSLVQSGGGTVPAQPLTYNSLTMTATLQPASALLLGTAYTASILATDIGGGAMPAPYTWTFVTTPAPLHVTIMDDFGGLHAVGSVNTAGAPYWQGRTIARGIAQLPEKPGSSGGYTLDAFGGVHPWGTATTVVAAAWPGWDIARGIALNPCDTSGNSGYVLDGFGGVHAFGDAPEMTVTAYWPNWDVARSLALNPCTAGDTAVSGYVMDAFGGLHGMSSGAGIADISGAPYWPGWAIARGFVLSGHGQGYTLDGFGGVHAFGGAPVLVASVYWPGWDIARGITLVPGGAGGGYVLDGFGGIHAFGTPTPGTSPAYWPGWDIAASISSG